MSELSQSPVFETYARRITCQMTKLEEELQIFAIQDKVSAYKRKQKHFDGIKYFLCSVTNVRVYISKKRTELCLPSEGQTAEMRNSTFYLIPERR
jgi:hypothetical protein